MGGGFLGYTGPKVLTELIFWGENAFLDKAIVTTSVQEITELHNEVTRW